MSDFIEFTNEHGQRVEMSREEYEKKVIPHNLKLYWDEREPLRQYAMELVRDQFPKHAAKAADRLLELYGRIEPALNFRAIVHMQAGELEQAKRVLAECITQFPESGGAYSNLAKIFALEGDEQKAFETLQASLVLDPNQENGLDMYVQSFLQFDKRAELYADLQKLGEPEHAWRPHLLLGKFSLQDGNLLAAMQSFQEAIKRSNENEQVLMNVTGELGQAGYVYQLIQIAEQYWKPDFEYPYTGFNFASAYLATEQADKALGVLQQMRDNGSDQIRAMVEQFVARIPEEIVQQAAAPAGNPETATETAKKSWWKIW